MGKPSFIPLDQSDLHHPSPLRQVLRLLAESGDPDTHRVLRLHDFFYYKARMS